jgi:hypothetical protein
MSILASLGGIPVMVTFGMMVGFGGFSTGLPGYAAPLTAAIWWTMLFVGLVVARWFLAQPVRPGRTAVAAGVLIVVQALVAYFVRIGNERLLFAVIFASGVGALIAVYAIPTIARE